MMVHTFKPLKYMTLWMATGLIFLSSGAPSFADSARARLTLGLSTLPLKVSGLENIHISDRKPGSPDATTENRLALNIAENNTSTFFAPGVKFDAGYAVIPDELDLLLEVGVNIMEAKAVSIGLGADFTVYRDAGLHLQGLGRLGLIGLRVGGTRATAVEGFENVVTVDFGTMRVGDEIQATLGGIYASSGVACSWELFDGVWLRTEAAAFQAFLGPLKLEAIEESDNDRDDNNSTRTRIPLDSASIIEPDVTTNTLLDLKPRGDSLGLSIFVGLSFDSDFSGSED
ncbi:MAG: hypothetical protein VX210_11665 [Myxococcota bacterium]|nr:hypothetical protein [Myxococcota bacterium]